MSIKKYVSHVKILNWDNKIVYYKLSDLSFLNIMFGAENMNRVKNEMGNKAKDMNIQNFISDRNTCSFDMSPIGKVSFHIEERDEPKTVKIVSDESTQFKYKLWIQLIPVSNIECKMRVTLHIELNMMMKMAIGKKLDKGINQIADGIAQIPFGMI